MREILHISDIHFGPKHQPSRSSAVLALIEERAPDLVVISGDLTQRAKPRQFREAREFVDRIGPPTLAVPGNHDVPMYRFWERLFAQYGAYRKHFSPELEPLFEDEELFVLGINSAFNFTHKHGRVTRRRLLEVESALMAAPAEKTRIVVIHHELVPARDYGTRRALRNARRALAVFERAGVAFVLSGHLHQAFIARPGDYYPELDGAPLQVFTGTTTSSRGRGRERGRNTLNWVTVGDGRFLVETLTWDDGHRGFVEERRSQFPLAGGRATIGWATTD